MKTVRIETFNGKIKIGTDGDCDWIPIITTCNSESKISVIIKEVDGTEPLGPNERWMGIDEFIRKMGNSEIVHATLKEFIKMGYTIKIEKLKIKRG